MKSPKENIFVFWMVDLYLSEFMLKFIFGKWLLILIDSPFKHLIYQIKQMCPVL